MLPIFVLRAVQRRDSLLVLVLRMLSLFLLALALANPAKRYTGEERELSALFDVSRSVSKKGAGLFLDSLKPFVAENTSSKVLLYPFGRTLAKKPLVVSSSSNLKSLLPELERAANLVDSGETNIAEGISSLLNREGNLSSVLLLSDGFETSGDGRTAASSAGNAGVRIYPLVPDEEAFSEEDLRIASVYAPLTAHAGDIAEGRVTIRNESPIEKSARLEVFFDQKKLFSRLIEVPGNEERLFSVKTPELEGGMKRLRATLNFTSEGKNSTSYDEHRWISVKNKSRILLLSGTAEDRRVLAKLLNLKGYSVDDIITDGQSRVPEMFDDYSTVILNNSARRQLPSGFLSGLKNFVERGGGLLLVGGERSFGLGDYINSPLEEISPLKFVPPQTEKRRVPAAVELVMDKSRSMLEGNRIDAAKRAALTAINALKDDDFVGVIGFDNGPFVIIRLESVSTVKPVAERRLRNLTAAGGTNLLPALSAARRELARSKAGRKHIIVLSDGKVPVLGNEYENEIALLQRAGITVSAIALGLDADKPFMQSLATGGRGAFYQTLDPSNLPELFVRDIKVSTGEKTLKEDADFEISVGPDGISSTGVQRYPIVKGFVETLPKRDATLELITTKNNQPYPILASWSYGSGKVAAFTSDANGRWSSPWLPWEGFHRFWGELIETVKNKTGLSSELDFDLRYSVQRGDVLLDLAIFDDRLSSGAAPTINGTVIEPGGEYKQLAFQATAKGRFLGTVSHGKPGDYKVEIVYGKTKLPPLAFTLTGELFGETPGRGIDIQTLSDLAFQSGGNLNPDPKQVLSYKRTTERKEQLFIPLLIAAFFLILLEAFLREMGPPTASSLSTGLKNFRRLTTRATIRRAA